MNLNLPCKLWEGHVAKNGYGKISVNGKAGQLVHRVAYEQAYGPIPEGMTVDHVCHDPKVCVGDCLHRRCYEPEHLEIVTRGVNTLRGNTTSALNKAKTHCPRGHEYDGENTFVDTNGARNCRICNRLRQRRGEVRPDQKKQARLPVSGYRGVHQNTGGRWTARITVGGKTIGLGTFSTPEEAALVYNRAALEVHGEDAFLNHVGGGSN